MDTNTSEYLIHNAKIVNEGHAFKGSVLIKDDKISKIFKEEVPENIIKNATVIDASGKYLFPGIIDDHVHFREPGMTQKGDIESETHAAIAGGVTSFMDMPNTDPQTITLDRIEEKCKIAAEKSLANYAFYLGVTNENIDEAAKADASKICGLKVFLGSSTGNMLMNNAKLLEQLFSSTKLLIAVHSEDEELIRANLAKCKADFKEEEIPMRYHALIRNAEECYKASSFIVGLAKKYGTRLHLMHVTSAKELSLLDKATPLAQKQITAETCPQYLWFDDSQYDKLGASIKCNPAIKTALDKNALIEALTSGAIDVVGTDHAPHLPEEKEGGYLQAKSGTPQIQFSLAVMLELAKQGKITVEKVVEKMSHAPATLFHLEKRGFIRKGFYADLVLVDRNIHWTVEKDNILSKCGWSPYEGTTFSHKVSHTFVNGKLVYFDGKFDETTKGARLTFA